MEQLIINENYKILKVKFEAGKNMPRHFASSDAFIIPVKGRALIVFNDETVEVNTANPYSITAKKPHILKVIDNFEAYIVMANDAEIKFPDPA